MKGWNAILNSIKYDETEMLDIDDGTLTVKSNWPTHCNWCGIYAGFDNLEKRQVIGVKLYVYLCEDCNPKY